MDRQRLRELLELGHELRSVEFKSGCVLGKNHETAKIVRAMLSLANTRGGGEVVVGVEDDGATLTPSGLTPADLATWNFDDLADQVARYADPSLTFETSELVHHGSTFIGIEVDEFDMVPVLCRKSYDDVLRDGACYVRSRKKPETAEIPRHEDMRELLDLATEKALQRLIATTRQAGGHIVALEGLATEGGDEASHQRYDEELTQ